MTTDTAENVQELEAETADEAAEQAAAEASFGSMRGDEAPAAQPTPSEESPPEKSADEIAAEEAQRVEAEAARVRQEEEQWLSGVPASVRESLSAIAGFQGRIRNVEGHIGGLTSVTKELKSAMSAATSAAAAAGNDAPTDEQIAAAAGSSAKWSQMKEDFPEWTEAMEERLSTVGRGGAVDVEAIRKQVRDELAPEIASAVAVARRNARVDAVHEDWEETVQTPEFSTWFDSQPEDVKALGASDKPRDAIKLLDQFVAFKNPKNDPPADEPPPTSRPNPRARLEESLGRQPGGGSHRSVPLSEEAAAEAAYKRVRTGGG